jgi:hypothetical protein
MSSSCFTRCGASWDSAICRQERRYNDTLFIVRRHCGRYSARRQGTLRECYIFRILETCRRGRCASQRSQLAAEVLRARPTVISIDADLLDRKARFGGDRHNWPQHWRSDFYSLPRNKLAFQTFLTVRSHLARRLHLSPRVALAHPEAGGSLSVWALFAAPAVTITAPVLPVPLHTLPGRRPRPAGLFCMG